MGQEAVVVNSQGSHPPTPSLHPHTAPTPPPPPSSPLPPQAAQGGDAAPPQNPPRHSAGPAAANALLANQTRNKHDLVGSAQAYEPDSGRH